MLPEFIDEDPATFHARVFDTTPLQHGGAMWVPRLGPTKTLVLGSSQDRSTINVDALAAAGIGLTTRKTGGGAVLVSDADLVWFDIVIDRSHRQWDDDVVRSFDWLGRGIQRVLTDLGFETHMHTGRLEPSPWSREVCFAGLGPGELVVDDGQHRRKVVGISQRRTRDRARFQVAVLKRWSGAEHAAFLAAAGNDTSDGTANDIAERLEEMAMGLPVSSNEIISKVAAALEG